MNTEPLTDSAPAYEVEMLEQIALDSVSKGQAPPAEVYDVRYRRQIDWLKFPSWAQPASPELYEGCSHEG